MILIIKKNLIISVVHDKDKFVYALYYSVNVLVYYRTS